MSLCSASRIMSYAFLETCLLICGAADTHTQELWDHIEDLTLMLKGLVIDFLKGAGVPALVYLHMHRLISTILIWT